MRKAWTLDGVLNDEIERIPGAHTIIRSAGHPCSSAFGSRRGSCFSQFLSTLLAADFYSLAAYSDLDSVRVERVVAGAARMWVLP